MTAVSENSAALDSVLRHHLSLDSTTNPTKEDLVSSEVSQNDPNIKNSRLTKRVSLKEFKDKPTGSVNEQKFLLVILQITYNYGRAACYN